MSLRRRSRRKITVNIQLSKQDLQEYLDDGYTAADIAKDFNVRPAIITEKIKKFGVKKTLHTKVVKKRGNSTLPAKKKPRGRPPKRPSSPRKGKGDIKERDDRTSKTDSESVITQVIHDNPDKSLDHIHSLLKSMGFDFEKSSVEVYLKKAKADSAGPHKEEETPAKEDNVSNEGDERSQETGRGFMDKNDLGEDPNKSGVIVSHQSEDGSLDKSSEVMNSEQLEKSNGSNDNRESTSQKVDGSSEDKVDVATSGSIGEDEPVKLELVKKRGRGRPRKERSEHKDPDVTNGSIDHESEVRPVRKRRRGRPRKVCIKDEDASTEDSDDENAKEESWLDDEDIETRKEGKRRGRKRKIKIKKDVQTYKRGRPCLDLSEENLKHCIESGLPREKIAEVFGTCRRSISRYLQIHRMRKKDRFSNISDDELDKLVSEISSEHPEWGQLQIQEELAKKGLYFRRHQVRNSVRRVDPIGIELRKLNNLKLRWNRGSLKKLDKILPADGINMTSTESFISQPPRTGLNSLNQEDSVRLLKSILTSNEVTYVEHVPHKRDATSVNSPDRDVPSVKEEPLVNEENSVLNNQNSEQEVKIVEELLASTQKVNNKGEMVREVAKEASDQENIGPHINQQVELKIESPQPTPLEDEKEVFWKEKLYKMVMSNKRAGREAAAQKRGAAVHIPKEELEKCVKLGFSSARIAEKFGTNKRNVRRHLNVYKLGSARRFEKISDDEIDDIVTEVIQEFAIRKGSEVYSYIKRKGYQIRKVDVHKSLSRLFPKGLHRKAPSIVKQSWDSSSEPHPSDISYIVTQEHGVGTGENVVMLHPEDFAQLMNGEGSIVLVDQEGTRRDGDLVVVSQGQGSQISTSIVNTVVPTEATQHMVKPEENHISAIILEIDFPENQTSGVSVEGSDHMGGQGSTRMSQSGTSQHLPQDVVVVDETQRREDINNVVVLNADSKSSERGTGSDEPQLIIDHPEFADPQEQSSSAEQEVSLTSLNTVRPSELDAQVLLELDRIAQNYQASKGGHSLVVPQQTNNGEGVL